MSPTTIVAPNGPLTDQQRDAFLSQIPSETTLAERQLLFNLFKNSWSGTGHVVEIGPFLGGTTRAIALGMAHNPRLSAESRLHTFDRFGAYYTPEAKRKIMEPFVRSGVFAAGEMDALCQTEGFLNLFQAIHAPHDYNRLIEAHSSPMPDFPEEIDTSTALACFDSDHALSALFIDGCKSWASTYYAMKFLLPRTLVGAPIIFQDFGWYTCFWISAVVHALDDVLEWHEHADSTYVFRLKTPISAEEVARRFAKTPEEMGPAFFQKSSTALFQRSQLHGDRRGALIAQLHHVAALVTIGRKDRAAAVLKNINVREYANHLDMIQGCIKSPTYRADGKPIRWNES